ncbi:DUF559 domain-containing protein [Candidatus Woesearchaeota archaeon]|nr:DUF559 domain-containing protein [Candidatus Woesearchaeota archaeon]
MIILHQKRKRKRIVPFPRRHYNQYKYAKAKQMRDNPTPAEKRMEEILENEIVPNFPMHSFQSQHCIFGYILDFYCPTLKLCVEVDGDTHKKNEEYDIQRDKNLLKKDIETFRFFNWDIFNNKEKIINSLCKYIEEITSDS